ncbi:phosphatase PAP2 family protein [Halorientalis salina]|uniref:phosphatase PAP2 family protein n=1 Tax=Halorientalis salina TaxID=2932266 RepID=UPI0010ABD41A|nr:phosphatase PAP2 family protein [Halorientalis salina]
MSHGVGAISTAQGILGPLVPVFALVTQLGDVWFLLVLLSTLYLADGRVPGFRGLVDRRDAAYVVALAIGGLALTVGLKLLVAFPRPPAEPVNGAWLPGPLFELYASVVHADGYGFPSGHAIGSTVVYGGLALVYGDSISRRRLLLAGGLAGLIGFSRVAIGVHHLVSVLGGFAIGAAYLGLATAVTDNGRRVGLAYLLAVVAGVVALFGGGFTRDPVIALGMALGGWLIWQVAGERIAAVPTSTAGTRLLLAAGLPVVGALFVGMELLEPALSLTFLLSVLIVAVLLVLPVAVGERKR